MEDPFEVKLDRALAFLQGVKDIPTLLRIMETLGITPDQSLDITNRRTICRALTYYLNDEKRFSDPQIDEQCE